MIKVVRDIAKELGEEVQFLSGDISSCIRVDIPLADGGILRLQAGDTDDHYKVQKLSLKERLIEISRERRKGS